jgi:hypothetical protein
MRHKHFVTWNMARNTHIREMRNKHCRTWIMAKKLKNGENEMQTLFDLEYVEKHSKTWKMGKAHSRTWSMARKMKIIENEKQNYRT